MSYAEGSKGCEYFFFLAQSSCYYFNLIAFIKSIETDASLLAPAKFMYYNSIDVL